PSKRKSSACVDYVPALCTHRPSLLPIEWLSEASGLAQGGRQRPPRAGKLSKLGHLEEVKVVTRSPLVNQRRDHYRVAKLPQTIANLTRTVASALAVRKALGPPDPRVPRSRGAARRSAETKLLIFYVSLSKLLNKSKLSTTDLLVLASMKNAAKCDK